MLTPAQLKQNTQLSKLKVKKAPLYLELNHTPSFARINEPLQTVIPLQQKQIDVLMDHIYTTRFDVKNGVAIAYRGGESYHSPNEVRLPGVPDGRFQFDNGRAEQVGSTALLTQLPKDHPLNNRSLEMVQKLYNYGLEWIAEPNALPNRYAYFRDGDLYLLGTPILTKDDPILQDFLKQEDQREQSTKGYIAFKDRGPPLKDGKIDKEFLDTFGLKIPEKGYLVLGDNHAISGDSRIMGFIPKLTCKEFPIC